MNRKEHILTVFSEECAEVAQRASKALRFSLKEIRPGQAYSNAELIMHEYADVVGMMEKMIEERLVTYPEDFTERVKNKKTKFEILLNFSKEQGTLN
jgi:hypothetical protein